jgi:hypothetical protein
MTSGSLQPFFGMKSPSDLLKLVPPRICEELVLLSFKLKIPWGESRRRVMRHGTEDAREIHDPSRVAFAQKRQERLSGRDEAKNIRSTLACALPGVPPPRSTVRSKSFIFKGN